MSRVIEKLLLFLGLCSRLREALVFDLVFFVSAKLKSELSALLSASGSLRDGFGMGSGFVNMEVYVIVPSKSQVSPIICGKLWEDDGKIVGETSLVSSIIQRKIRFSFVFCSLIRNFARSKLHIIIK